MKTLKNTRSALLCAAFIALMSTRLFADRSAPQSATAAIPAGMVLIPGGAFAMGSNAPEGIHNPGDAVPRHIVTLPDFYIAKTEVTNAQYQKFCDATGAAPPSHWNNGTHDKDKADFPVTHVNWFEAQAYAQWQGKRLPSEAEWEKAARGTDARLYPWGNNWDDNRLVWERDGPQRVGSKPAGASPYGALDMAGNAYEWTADWYGPYPGAQRPQQGYGQTYKVLRGGGFSGDAYDATTIHRSVLQPRVRSSWVGFRCVQDREMRGVETAPQSTTQ